MSEENAQNTEAAASSESQVSDSLLAGITDASILANGKPDSLPDDFWDKEKNTPIVEKIIDAYTHEKNRADGLRKKLSKGEFESGAPDDPKEYNVELGEELKDLQLEGDSVWEAARVAAKEAGIPKETFAKFIAPVLQKMHDIAPKEPTTEDIAAYKAQELEKLGPSGIKIAHNVKAFVNELEAKGILVKEDIAEVQSMITTAGALRVFNRIRAAMTNVQDVPVATETVLQSNASKAELEAKLIAAANSGNEAQYNAIAAQLHKFAT